MDYQAEIASLVARLDAMQANERRLLDKLAESEKNAQRYRWHRARNPAALLANAWVASRAACAIGADCDAATDAAMAEAPAVGGA